MTDMDEQRQENDMDLTEECAMLKKQLLKEQRDRKALEHDLILSMQLLMKKKQEVKEEEETNSKGNETDIYEKEETDETNVLLEKYIDLVREMGPRMVHHRTSRMVNKLQDLLCTSIHQVSRLTQKTMALQRQVDERTKCHEEELAQLLSQKGQLESSCMQNIQLLTEQNEELKHRAEEQGKLYQQEVAKLQARLNQSISKARARAIRHGDPTYTWKMEEDEYVREKVHALERTVHLLTHQLDLLTEQKDSMQDQLEHELSVKEERIKELEGDDDDFDDESTVVSVKQRFSGLLDLKKDIHFFQRKSPKHESTDEETDESDDNSSVNTTRSSQVFMAAVKQNLGKVKKFQENLEKVKQYQQKKWTQQVQFSRP
eukprot:CAMPEP_0118701948 /NCGR_PEP_ID=MMETSP0800-20121206/17577_1 /TAXON_ID=210618 ORGANISM="Striatella unipunctata, Strain CCMP2910" /NCGR_SAMPLE_ID=MMETSP0800 /ASSEMBLY_ACC=CAM_ASM_000638 /LENGTH=372 /DNA_ID=CAMNT_0006603011 /DNA_START=37 /DNA_END=1155 /DNA_ORIENTATION=+